MVRLRNKYKIKHGRCGPPANVSTPIIDRNNPDNYPSLIRFLEATGKIQHITQLALMKARYYYLRGENSVSIAEKLKREGCGAIRVDIIDRWALCFSWDEERDRRLFEQFRKIAGTEELYGKNISQRHDRIAGSIEQVAERLLQKSANGEIALSTQDLTRLAATIKATQDIRRTSRGENIDRKVENKTVDINVQMPHSLERVASALVSMTERPRLKITASKTIAVGNEESISSDTELETAERKSETSS